ncbi:phage baseplate assembly protein V [Cellulomonas palmilytica]|uniref:phage baseplate assembly protein V n=1 Tax=Cellulomonas palmilytica TaxID=2608402 RepID=UPI001F3C467C|nr:phage baseplate assembly protein V [Cellulomonas palmilytica]UJP41050.1 hypothetical protein F1D97_06220 [Cellulomonas palmilytica]
MTVLRDEKALTWPRILVAGQELAEEWTDQLESLRVERALRTIGRAWLRFTDSAYALAGSSTFAIGEAVEISSVTTQGLASTTLLTGTVTAVESALTERGELQLTVTVDDFGVGLTRSAEVTTFHEMSYTQVVAQLVGDAGLTAEVAELPTAPVAFALRSDTALATIDDIAVRYGCDWVVEGQALHVWSASSGSLGTSDDLTAGVNLLAFAVRQVTDATTEVTVRGWDPKAQEAVTASAQTPSPRAGRQPQNSDATFTRTDAHASTSSQEDAQAVATGLAARTGRIVARGRCLYQPTLRPGTTVSVAGMGPNSGAYYVREVTHTVDRAGSTTAFVAGDRDPVRLVAAPPTSAASTFRRGGLVVGVVDNVKDPDALGRVSVSLSTASDQAKSAWARVTQPGAGSGRGHLFLPHVGDEVLVGFENDDPNRPVVIGGLYGTKAAPHRAAIGEDGAVVAQAIKTRTGHVIELSEGTSDAEQHILLSLASGARLRVGKDAVVLEAPDGVPLTLNAGQSSLAFDGNGKVTLTGTTLELKARSKVDVSSSADVAVKAGTGLALQGMTATFKGTASTVVESGAVAEVKGTMVKIN